MKDNEEYTSVELEECTEKKCTISFLSDTSNKLIYINKEGKNPKIECRIDSNLTFSKEFSKYATIGNIQVNETSNVLSITIPITNEFIKDYNFDINIELIK